MSVEGEGGGWVAFCNDTPAGVSENDLSRVTGSEAYSTTDSSSLTAVSVFGTVQSIEVLFCSILCS